MRRLVRAGAIAIFAFVTLPVQPQTFGEITGTVTDTTSAVIVGATVTITNVATNQVRHVSTNEAGNYTVPFLFPGLYNIQVESTGFKPSVRRDVDLQVGAVARANFILELGAVTEVVDVRGGAPLLDTDSTALGTVIENRRIVELPLNGRNYLQMIALSPNVTAEMSAGGTSGARLGGERAAQAFSVAGQRQLFNRFTLDGVENTDVQYNSFVVRPSIDALQEFKIQTGVYSAEHGRATSQISATTKPGSNQFHGTLFEFHRNENLDAKEWRLDQEKNPFVRNQFGFTLGGRLVRDKLFFMSNFESLRERKTLQGTANVATERMRAGDFGGQPRAISDHLTRVYAVDAQGNERAVSAAPFPNNVIPPSRFSPVSLKLLEFYPAPTVRGDEILRNYVRQRPRPVSWEQFTQRLDWNESAASNWFGRFSWGDEFLKQIANFPTNEGRTETRVYQAMLSNTRILSSTVVNEFRFGYNQFQNQNLLHFGNIRDVASELGIAGLTATPSAAWGVPAIGFEAGLTGFGEGGGPFVTRNHTFQWIDNLSVIRGNHSLKFGGEIRRDRYNQFGDSRASGLFNFQAKTTFDPANRASTGHAFADFLLGEVRHSERSLGLANTMFRATSYSVYAEDTWKITPRLTMNIGLRYEYTPPWRDKYRGIMNVQLFDPGVGPGGLLATTKVPVLMRPGSGDFYEGLPFRFHDALPVQAGNDFIGRGLVLPDRNDFAPRFGLSYSPSDRWTVRTGFGVFYSQDSGDPRFDMSRNLAGRVSFDSDEERPNSNMADPWVALREQFQCANWSGPCLGPPFVTGNVHYRRTPYVMQWLLNIQRQLTENLLFEVGYQGNAGRKLEDLRAYNEAVQKAGPNDNRTIAQRSPWPAYGRMQMVDNFVKSNYNGLSTKLQQRFARGLTYMLGFTWSKAIDYGSSIRQNDGDRLFPVNNYDFRAERALSQFHSGRRLVASVLYELPVASRRKVLRQVASGWQVGSIVTFSDGTPYDVGSIGDSNNIGGPGPGNRPDATGISPFSDNPGVDQFWNIGAFDAANRELTWRFGNVSRNPLLTPGVRQWDFSLVKNTVIREGHSLQFRFEAFNFANHPNWNTPGTDVRNPATFGKITSARTMRELQLGLKYVF